MPKNQYWPIIVPELIIFPKNEETFLHKMVTTSYQDYQYYITIPDFYNQQSYTVYIPSTTEYVNIYVPTSVSTSTSPPSAFGNYYTTGQSGIPNTNLFISVSSTSFTPLYFNYGSQTTVLHLIPVIYPVILPSQIAINVVCQPNGSYCGFHADPVVTPSQLTVPESGFVFYMGFNTGPLYWYLQPVNGTISFLENGYTVTDSRGLAIITYARTSKTNATIFSNSDINVLEVNLGYTAGTYELTFATCYDATFFSTNGNTPVPGQPLLAKVIITITTSIDTT